MKLRILLIFIFVAGLAAAMGVGIYFLHEHSTQKPALIIVAPPPAPTGPSTKTIVLKEGDTLASVLDKIGVDPVQAFEASDALEEVFSPKDLRAEQSLQVVFQDHNLISLSFRPEFEFDIKLTQKENGFKAEKVTRELTHDHTAVRGTIQDSLYVDGLRAGASPQMLDAMIKAFSYDVDFQRDIQPGTTFSLFYDTYKDEAAGLERPGELLAATLVIDDKPLKIYRFHPKGGVPGFYSEKGEGVKKALLKTPIDGARIGSGFGMRRHPILGYTKLHKGVDFAAPTGTPIMAAGDGVVERCNRYGSYGNYICIRHSGGTKTAYAHLSRYVKGMKAGKKVQQGQIIGYVGSTGRATGAHLHFELIQNGKHVNPKKVTQLPSSKLGGKLLKEFKAAIASLEAFMKAKAQ